MPLNLIIEEIEGGFHFRDSFVDIQVMDTGNGYEMRFESIMPKFITRLKMNAKNKKSVYNEFRMAIDDYLSRPLDEAWRIIHEDKIKELFEPLAKYE